MVANDMLKQAVSNLRQAAQLRKREADDLRSELARIDQEQKDKINQYRQDESMRLAQAATADSDSYSAKMTRDAQLLQIEESRTKNDYERIKRETDAKIAMLQKNAIDIDQNAQMIERSWYTI